MPLSRIQHLADFLLVPVPVLVFAFGSVLRIRSRFFQKHRIFFVSALRRRRRFFRRILPGFLRELFDYGLEHFLSHRPILFALTVTTAPGGIIRTHGLFLGEGRDCLTHAVKLAQEKNIDFLPTGLRKCVVYLDPSEFKSTWLGNKAIYRTRMAMADGGDLIILAPGVERFGEDDAVDRLIRKYGYRGRLNTLKAFRSPENQDLRENMGAAAHLIHGSSDGRFRVESVGFLSVDYEETARLYDPSRLRYGLNSVNGEEIYFIPNPALGLWIDRSRFESEG